MWKRISYKIILFTFHINNGVLVETVFTCNIFGGTITSHLSSKKQQIRIATLWICGFSQDPVSRPEIIFTATGIYGISYILLLFRSRKLAERGR